MLYKNKNTPGNPDSTLILYIMVMYRIMIIVTTCSTWDGFKSKEVK